MLLRNLVLELGVRVIYPEIVPYMKTWNPNWPVCIKRNEPQSLLVVMWPMTLPCSPWPNICLVTGFIFFLDIIIHVHNGVKILLKSHLFREHSHTTSDFQVGRQVGQAESDFTKQAYVVKYLIRVGRQVKNAPKTSDVICECSLTP